MRLYTYLATTEQAVLDDNKNVPWESAGLKDGAMLSLTEITPVLDGPCIMEVFEDLGLVYQRW